MIDFGHWNVYIPLLFMFQVLWRRPCRLHYDDETEWSVHASNTAVHVRVGDCIQTLHRLRCQETEPILGHPTDRRQPRHGENRQTTNTDQHGRGNCAASFANRYIIYHDYLILDLKVVNIEKNAWYLFWELCIMKSNLEINVVYSMYVLCRVGGFCFTTPTTRRI